MAHCKHRVNGNPAIAYQQGLKAGKSAGVYDGFNAAVLLALLGLYNIYDEYLPEQQLPGLAKALESEMCRLLRDEMGGDPEDVAVKATYEIMRLREKLGMEVVTLEQPKV